MCLACCERLAIYSAVRLARLAFRTPRISQAWRLPQLRHLCRRRHAASPCGALANRPRDSPSSASFWRMFWAVYIQSECWQQLRSHLCDPRPQQRVLASAPNMTVRLLSRPPSSSSKPVSFCSTLHWPSCIPPGPPGTALHPGAQQQHPSTTPPPHPPPPYPSPTLAIPPGM